MGKIETTAFDSADYLNTAEAVAERPKTARGAGDRSAVSRVSKVARTARGRIADDRS